MSAHAPELLVHVDVAGDDTDHRAVFEPRDDYKFLDAHALIDLVYLFERDAREDHQRARGDFGSSFNINHQRKAPTAFSIQVIMAG